MTDRPPQDLGAFAGIVRFDGAPNDRLTESRIAAALTVLRKGQVFAGRQEGALFMQRVPAPGSGESRLAAGRDGRSLFAALARLDNRTELAAALAMPPSELAQTADAALVLRIFDRWGNAGIARCLGAFAFAHWDAGRRRLTLARDCLGNRALFVHRGRGFAAFATTLNTLFAIPGVPREIDEIVLANYLALNLGDLRRTFYRGIERVPSRSLMTIDSEAVRHRHYWSAEADAPPYRRDEDYVERARELLDQAVACATRGMTRLAIATSGGLDSSAIAATAARLGTAERIDCYTLVPPADAQFDVGPVKYPDERSKVAALAEMHPALRVHLLAPDEPHAFELDNVRYFARTGLPVLNPGNLGWFGFLNDAMLGDGHRVQLTGNRGNLGLTWTGHFSLLALLRSGAFGTFLHELPATAHQTNRSLIRTLAGDVVLPAAPAFARRIINRLRGRDPHSVTRYSMLNPAFVAECGLGRQWRAQGFDPWFGASGWDPAAFRAHYLFDHNQFARDTAAMSSEQRGFEMRDPHSDRRFLEFLLAVPERLYRCNGMPRAFARRVLADRLPREILDERRTGAQGGAWFRRLDMMREDVALEIERLETSSLARRLLDLPRLKQLLTEWPKDENAAQLRRRDYHLALGRGVHIGRFIRWVEGGNR